MELLKYFPRAQVHPAGFGYKGFHADTEIGRLNVLPGTVHLCCEIDGRDRVYLDWLFPNAYGISHSFI
jgi:hypothetical protein